MVWDGMDGMGWYGMVRDGMGWLGWYGMVKNTLQINLCNTKWTNLVVHLVDQLADHLMHHQADLIADHLADNLADHLVDHQAEQLNNNTSPPPVDTTTDWWQLIFTATYIATSWRTTWSTNYTKPPQHLLTPPLLGGNRDLLPADVAPGAQLQHNCTRCQQDGPPCVAQI